MTTAIQWFVWGLGIVASIAVLMVIPFAKSGPDWYAPVFVAAAVYCVAASVMSIFMRRWSRDILNLQGWTRALSTARLGFLGLIGVLVIMAALLGLGIAIGRPP